MNSWLYADTAERFSHHIGIQKCKLVMMDCPDPVGVARMCDDPRNTVLFHHFLNALQEEKTEEEMRELADTMEIASCDRESELCVGEERYSMHSS